MKNCICQSCGMPLYHFEMCGTGADGMRIGDYCIHCYKNGGFTSDVTMEEMIQLCANYVNGNTRFYIANMRTLYPHLKRWAKKEDTENEYYKSINKVLNYIKKNLYENTDLKTLASIAHISPYHFHRIFKSIIGESVGEYINRLRMEYVAEQLKTSGLSLAELAEKIGYSSEQALSRAFKKYFNLPPKTFKATFFKEMFQEELVPRICKVASKGIITLREPLPNKQAWRKLYMYAMVNHLLSNQTESIEFIQDDVYLPALTTKTLLQSDKYIETLVLPEGLYAIFTHKGQTVTIQEFYAAICNYWLPKSSYQQDSRKVYVAYLNNHAMTPSGALLTDIYLPITKRPAT